MLVLAHKFNYEGGRRDQVPFPRQETLGSSGEGLADNEKLLFNRTLTVVNFIVERQINVVSFPAFSTLHLPWVYGENGTKLYPESGRD